MSTKSKIIALGTALVIGAGALTTTASAAPLGAVAAAKIETGSGVETVKWKKKWGHHGHHGRHGALLGLGAAAALGTGIVIGSGAFAGPDCYRQEVKYWSPKHQAYVIKTERVCE